MFMDLKIDNLFTKNETIAVAASGGSDSMALLHYLSTHAKELGIKVKALNVEHGIRGEASKSDSNFVKIYCRANNIEVISYEFDTLKKAKTDKMSVEQAARVMRYDCFFDAINKGLCDKVATAHHMRDNVESVLLNMFRGTGLKGISGINANYEDKIVRPFLKVRKEDLSQYIIENGIPYVADETNFSDDYTRNFIRLNILPQIKKIFPEAEIAITRLAEIAKLEDGCIEKLALNAFKTENDKVIISLPQDKAVISRAVLMGLKTLGIEQDYEKIHADSILDLANKKNGAKVNLPKGIVAIKEYDNIVIYKAKKNSK